MPDNDETTVLVFPDPMDGLSIPLEAQELIDSYLGRAGMLANAIMMGLTEPDVEINGDVMLALGDEMAERLIAVDAADMRFPKRAVRALEWATRDDVTPEIALMFYSRVYSFLKDGADIEAEDGDNTVASAMAAFAARFAGKGFDEFLTPDASA